MWDWFTRSEHELGGNSAIPLRLKARRWSTLPRILN